MRASIACVVLGLAASGCADKPLSPSVQTGVSGTRLEAVKVVHLVYGQEPESAIHQLPYSAGGIAPAVLRMRERWPELKPRLESGELGLGARGMLVLRQPDAADIALKGLVRRENLDRDILYKSSQEDVGHGDDRIDNWYPHTQLVFAEEWAEQAPGGWWMQDDRGQWHRKESKPAP